MKHIYLMQILSQLKLIYGAILQDVVYPCVLFELYICKHENCSLDSAKKASLHLGICYYIFFKKKIGYSLPTCYVIRTIQDFKIFFIKFSFKGDHLWDGFNSHYCLCNCSGNGSTIAREYATFYENLP